MPQAKKSVADVAKGMFDLVSTLDSENQQKAISALLALLGMSRSNIGGSADDGAGGRTDENGGTDDAAIEAYFEEKDPQSKIEELAVVAHFRETRLKATAHTKDDFKAVIEAARRDFDSNNFNRDLDNAKTRGLLNRVPGNTLAYYGKKYVAAMPNRDDVKKVPAPRRGKRKSGRTRKASRKK